MMYKTHVAVGILAGLIAMNYFDVNKYAFLGAVVFGSLFVDIDENESYIGRRTWPVSNVVELFFGHRGMIHSIWAGGLIFSVLYFFGYLSISLGFLLGYISHLAADMLTVEGVRLFYPVSKFNAKGFIRTGGLLEKFFFAGVLVVIGYVIVV